MLEGPNVAILNFTTCYVVLRVNAYVPVVILYVFLDPVYTVPDSLGHDMEFG